MPIFDIHSTEDINNKILTSPNVVIVFHQPNCGACILYENTIDEVNKKFDNQNLVIIRMNVRENPNFARENLVQGTPTSLFYKNGKQVRRFEGYVTTEVLEGHLKNSKLIS
ncbi:thioredoxin family protein [Mesomycoplasma hyopneumoniae]|uniref:Thioredoxin n=5 Tax=Mesomycoplasma hyopneumoniae TaxID=2099 RepID=A0A223MAV4_MESHO|nr:thioredoxin family protein [Mesomycoplasma hyopneumoniae]AAV27862.1 thioredoxin [Mesomycoplasma hyopneumoniae 232]AAZ44468.1 putative thioredoxin [Mesomycoplasma hyopneumoniae J]ADQ90613.1 Thioredoxin [Mesomycoplasma hyopneumoniae 168]AGM22189.1 Thioredoxin [Mesomycoplasma hyopneumoniae 168-L]ASU14586.1 Thioredoxin [Mesomycoplasma hyopneumoniae]